MIREAFNQTLSRYDIPAKRLSEATGISENHISTFRRGASDIGSKKLWSLVEAMEVIAPSSKEYFCSQLANSSLMPVNLRSLVENFDAQELSTLLHIVAEKLKSGKSAEAVRVVAKV